MRVMLQVRVRWTRKMFTIFLKTSESAGLNIKA